MSNKNSRTPLSPAEIKKPPRTSAVRGLLHVCSSRLELVQGGIHNAGRIHPKKVP